MDLEANLLDIDPPKPDPPKPRLNLNFSVLKIVNFASPSYIAEKEKKTACTLQPHYNNISGVLEKQTVS